MEPSTTPPPDENAPPQVDPDAEADALESTAGESTSADSTTQAALAPPPKKKGLKAFVQRFNLYLLLFIFVLLLGGGVIMIAYLQGQKASNGVEISSQKLDQKALDQVANSNATVGDPKQILSIQSNAVFAGKVLVRDTLEVAGGIQVGGSVSLSGLTVSGKSAFDDVQVSKNLNVAGDTALQGGLSLQKGLQVNGGGTFNGPVSAPQVTTSNLQINGDLVLTHHLTAGGPTPSRTNGTALGSGGTSSVNGSDTSGSISINTGSNPPAGCFATINFAQKYNSVPHVTVTPVGAEAGALDFYINRSTSSFSICDASPPPPGASFGFDYFIAN